MIKNFGGEGAAKDKWIDRERNRQRERERGRCRAKIQKKSMFQSYQFVIKTFIQTKPFSSAHV